MNSDGMPPSRPQPLSVETPPGALPSMASPPSVCPALPLTREEADISPFAPPKGSRCIASGISQMNSRRPRKFSPHLTAPSPSAPKSSLKPTKDPQRYHLEAEACPGPRFSTLKRPVTAVNSHKCPRSRRSSRHVRERAKQLASTGRTRYVAFREPPATRPRRNGASVPVFFRHSQALKNSPARTRRYRVSNSNEAFAHNLPPSQEARLDPTRLSQRSRVAPSPPPSLHQAKLPPPSSANCNASAPTHGGRFVLVEYGRGRDFERLG